MDTQQIDEKAVFNAARLITDAAARDDYLAQECGDDQPAIQRIRELLRIHEQEQSFLESPPAHLAATTDHRPIAEQPGTIIGPYKLLQQIGEGGMGVVFMAEQTEPLQRTVALKIIKPGMDTRQVIARFEAERQAVAMMDHPNIAKVLDAGTTDTGRPYFVMELVKGVPITKYCDEKLLPLPARLELFVQVCQAVQHAHQKGIIHRDIKPNNVLVAEYDNHAVPKVIDFGVAKATAQRLTERTMFTEFGQVLGTMEYMSPEQSKFNQLDIDTRSDIYSLGVLLYELLAGSTPFEGKRLHAAAFDEMLRIIREEEPPKPSTRLSSLSLAERAGERVPSSIASIAANRHTEPARLSKDVQGELDWIVMKALEKDRNRRYETASGFAADIERHLHDEPVEAGPPSAVYKLRKFARRNKRVLTTMTLLGVMLLAAVGTVAGSLGWVSRGRAARQMVVEQAVARALEEADELQKQGKWQEALVAVQRAQAALAGGEAGTEVQQQVSDQLADLHMIQRMEQLRLQRGDDWDNKSANRAYARAFADFGIDVENLSPPEVAARIRRRPSTAVQMAAALDDWTMVLRDWGLRDRTRDPATWKRILEAARLADPDPWRSQLRQSMGQEDLNALRKLADASDITAVPAQSLQLMGNALIFGGDGPASVAWLRKAHRQHPGDALISFDLAFHLGNLPSTDWVEVLRFAEAGLAAQQSPGMYCFVGYALSKLGRHDEAIALYRKAIELQPDYVYAHANLGIALSERGRLDEAIAAYRKAIELEPDLAWAHSALGVALGRKGRHDEAIAACRKAIELKPDDSGAHNNLGFALAEMGRHDNKGRYDEAIVAYHKAIELKPDFAQAHNNLGAALSATGRRDEAIVAYRKAIELKPDYANAHSNLGNALSEQGKLDEAIACYCKAIELDPITGRFHNGLAWLLATGPDPKFRDPKRAVELAKKAVELAPKEGIYWNTLGLARYRAGEWKDAIDALKKSDELLAGEVYNFNAFFLAMAHWQLGEKEEARKWFDQAVEWMEKNKPHDEELKRFREEAAALLGVKDK